MTTREEIRLTLASIDARLDESRRGRQRELELSCQGLAAVARHRYPAAAKLRYVNDGGGLEIEDNRIEEIIDGDGVVLWTRDRSIPEDDRDKFMLLLDCYSRDLEFGSWRHDFLDWTGDGQMYLILPTLGAVDEA